MGFGFEEHLLDGRRLAAAADAYFYRVAQHRVAERTDGFREGGGEQQRLPVLRELLHDVAYLVLEAHVQHAVGLVEHQGAHAGQLQRLLRGELLDAARVPTTTCGAWPSEASCGPSGIPPHSTDSFRLGMPVASLRSCLPTWSASSRVGHSTSAWVRTASASIACRTPRPTPAVLPMPAGACAFPSRPSRTAAHGCPR